MPESWQFDNATFSKVVSPSASNEERRTDSSRVAPNNCVEFICRLRNRLGGGYVEFLSVSSQTPARSCAESMPDSCRDRPKGLRMSKLRPMSHGASVNPGCCAMRCPTGGSEQKDALRRAMERLVNKRAPKGKMASWSHPVLRRLCQVRGA